MDSNKIPIICKKDVSGFIVNRIFIPLVHEALFSMNRDKVSMDIIDSAVKFKLDFPMGIFELADYTGLDVIYKASYEMNLRDNHVLLMHPRIKELYESNQLGQKTGKGFYEYKKENYERVNLTEEKAAQYEPLSIIGVSDIFGGKFLDERNRILIETNNDPASAVDYIISNISFG